MSPAAHCGTDFIGAPQLRTYGTHTHGIISDAADPCVRVCAREHWAGPNRFERGRVLSRAHFDANRVKVAVRRERPRRAYAV